LKLQTLLLREDFIKIFKKTFEEYLLNNFGWEGEVNWIPKSERTKRNFFWLNQRLNLIYPNNLNRYFLDPFKKEFVYHKNPIRHLLQNLYVKLATYFTFESFFSTAVIEIEPWVKEIENFCIIPGNHSIRIINFRTNSCDVILKKGFNPKFIDNEIKIRSKIIHPSVPKLIDYDIKKSYFTEEKIGGLPLNRLGSQKQRSLAFGDSLDCLSKLYSKTRNTVDLQEWLFVLIDKLSSLESDLCDHKSGELWSDISNISSKLKSIIEKNGNVEITTTITHGDFQPANIIYNKRSAKTYLIDWEYSGRRYEPYDYYVFCYQTRFPRGLAKRLKKINIYFENFNTSSLSFRNFIDTNLNKSMLALLLFEDFLVRLEELYVPTDADKNLGLMIFINEVKHYLTYE